MSTEAPDYQDEVAHKTTGISGVVIAIYEKDGVSYLDVRADDHVYYETPAENWETKIPCDE